MATRVRSYSKINLGLRIGPVRADGFHGLVTLYQTLALHDWVTVEVKPGSQSAVQGPMDGRTGVPGAKARIHSDAVMPGLKSRPISQTMTTNDSGAVMPGLKSRLISEAITPTTIAPTKITLTTNDARVPEDARNTAWKMVERALERMGIAAEVAIHIEKELPVQGGMGAGSANAAAALIGLERELGEALPQAERLQLAAEVGSDVPLFLIGGAVLGTGRGEVVSAMPDLPRTWCVVAVPEVGVSTPRAFRDWDELGAAGPDGRAHVGGGGGNEGLCGDLLENDVPGAKARAASTSITPGLKSRPISGTSSFSGAGLSAVGGGQEIKSPGLTHEPQPDRLEELSHAYASVFGRIEAEQAPDTSGIVRGLYPGRNQGGSEEQVLNIGVSASGQSGTLNGLAGNTLLALVRTGIENDFETVVFPQYPLLREIKRLLMGTSAGVFSEGGSADSSGGAIYAALSGSGSALFGLYGTEVDARAAQRRVQASGCKAILTETLPRQEYWRRMFAE